MNKIIHAQSGHTLFVESAELSALPENVQDFRFIENYQKHYVVRNCDSAGVVFFYIAAEPIASKKHEFVVWYSNGGFWSGFGRNITEAINGAQRDGWMYA